MANMEGSVTVVENDTVHVLVLLLTSADPTPY